MNEYRGAGDIGGNASGIQELNAAAHKEQLQVPVERNGYREIASGGVFTCHYQRHPGMYVGEEAHHYMRPDDAGLGRRVQNVGRIVEPHLQYRALGHDQPIAAYGLRGRDLNGRGTDVPDAWIKGIRRP